MDHYFRNIKDLIFFISYLVKFIFSRYDIKNEEAHEIRRWQISH